MSSLKGRAGAKQAEDVTHCFCSDLRETPVRLVLINLLTFRRALTSQQCDATIFKSPGDPHLAVQEAEVNDMFDNYVLRANLQTLQFQSALVEISRAASADLDNALSRISTLAADALDTARVSIWLFNEEHTELRCLHLFDRERNTHESGAILAVEKYPRYFKALEESRTIPAEVARTHPCTSEFAVG